MSSDDQLVVLDERRLVREGTSLLLDTAGYVVVASYPSFEACAADIAALSPETLLILGRVAGEEPPKSLREFRAVPLADSLTELVADILAEMSCETPMLAVSPVLPARNRPVYSEREQQILDLISQGMSADQMAKFLGLSRSTIEHHKQQMFVRVGVQSQAHAVAMSRRTRRLNATAG